MATHDTFKIHDLKDNKSADCTSLFTIRYPYVQYGYNAASGSEYKTKKLPCQEAAEYLQMMQYHHSSFSVEHYTIKKGEDVYFGKKESFKNVANNIELFNTNPKNLLVDKPPVKPTIFSKAIDELALLNRECDGSI